MVSTALFTEITNCYLSLAVSTTASTIITSCYLYVSWLSLWWPAITCLWGQLQPVSGVLYWTGLGDGQLLPVSGVLYWTWLGDGQLLPVCGDLYWSRFSGD